MVSFGTNDFMGAKIYSTDSCKDIAKKIFETFDPGDIVQVYGFVTDMKTGKTRDKGDAVLEDLRWFYEFKHYGHAGRARTYEFVKDSIGGPILHPIFTWEKRIVDSEPRYTIWRKQ